MDELTETKEKKSLFSRVISFFANLSPRRRRVERYYSYSKFKQYLLDLEKDDEAYSYVSYSIDLCDEALDIVKKRLNIIRKIQSLDENIAGVECYNLLTDEEGLYLKDMLERIISLSNDRKALMYQVTGFDKSLMHLLDLEEEVPGAIRQMEEAEKNQRLFRQDMGILEGEKENLEYEKDMYSRAQKFIQGFSIFLVALFGVITLIMAFFAVFQGADIFFPLTVMVFMAIILICLIYIVRRQIKYELAMNLKKQRRAVELLNKKTTLFVHHTNFLRYAYKKYQVKSSQALKRNLSEFNSYRHLTGRLDSITNIMYQTEHKLDDFLRSKNITNTKATSLKFAKTLDIDDKKRYYNDLMREKTTLEGSLASLDTRHEEIWNQLVELNNTDKSKNSVIEQILQTYLDEVGKYVNMVANQPVDFEDDDEEFKEEENEEDYETE